jgi:hypothetical protein
VSNAPKKKETAKITTAHNSAKRKQTQIAHQTPNLDAAQCKRTVPKQKIKVQTKQRKVNTARYEQTPGPEYKINNTQYGNREWNGEKETEAGKSDRKKQDNPGERKKQNQKKRNEEHTNQAQWEKQRGENQRKKR